jgi:diguanylate cyclase (GGDEF)-like protein
LNILLRQIARLENWLATTSVAWVAPLDDAASWLADELGRRGHALVDARSEDGAGAALRVLWAHFFATPAACVDAYHADRRPTLLVVASVEEEAFALGFLRETDDVVRIDRGVRSLAETFARRLARVAQLAQEVEQARAASTRDGLTGLANRTVFTAEGERWCEDNLGASPRALLLLDIDHFKSLNDQFGHAAGDFALADIAQRICGAAAPGDCVYRFGGEEFAVLLSRTTREEIVVAAQRIRNGARTSRTLAANQERDAITLTLSAALSFLVPGQSLAGAIREADDALYAAKAAGRDRLVTYASLVEAALANEQDIGVLNFQNVTKVVTERVTNLVTLFGKGLLEEAQRQAKTDALTALKNKRYFDERIAREVDLARRDGRKLSIAMLDLDHFGRFNKEFGVPTGDQVLKVFAEIASASIRSIDWLARYGGEEFCLVVPGDVEDAITIAERIRANLEAKTVATGDNEALHVTVSIGVAQFTPDLAGPTQFVGKASQALQQAKRLGRNQVYGKA